MTSGLRLVDYEECAIGTSQLTLPGLIKYRYYWIGSGIRTSATTLLFIETTKIEPTAKSGEGERESSFMGTLLNHVLFHLFYSFSIF